jgi:hypothetical protein
MKNIMETVMVTITDMESGMDYLAAMVDEYDSEMVLMTGRLAFGRKIFSGMMDYWSYGVLE